MDFYYEQVSLINFTFFLSINFNNSPPLVTIKDLQLFSGK